MPEPKVKLIDGESFNISQPYSEGHSCNAAEAKTLNQVRSENIGNNLRQTVKDAKELRDTKGDTTAMAKLAALVEEYDRDYIFTTSAGGSGRIRLDPVEREALTIAREQVKLHLAKDGRKLTTPPTGKTKEEWVEAVNEEIERVAALDEVLAEAKKRVKQKEKFSIQLGDGKLAA